MAALEALGVPSLIVDERGRVMECNRLARDWLEKEPVRAAAEVLQSLLRHPGQGAFSVRRLEGEASSYFFLVRRAAVDDDRVASCVQEVVARHALTRGQSRVLALVATGASNRAVAAQLGISERTVETHVTAILNQLDVDSRAGLVAYVLGR